MSQHYDILSVNAVLLLASGCGYMIVGQQNTGVVLLLLSLCNIVGIITKRIADLEQQRKEMELLADIEDEAEEEAEEEEEEETEDEQEDAQPPVTDVHYCGSEQCGAEITNLDGAGLCAGCGLVYYCDTTCQRADWKAGHKLVCDRNTSVHSADIVAEEADVVADIVAEEQPVTQEAPLPPSPESEPPVSDLPPPPPPPARATKAPYAKDTGFIV
jgi:hypothetical protein